MKAIKMFSAGFLRGARVFDNYSEASCRGFAQKVEMLPTVEKTYLKMNNAESVR